MMQEQKYSRFYILCALVISLVLVAAIVPILMVGDCAHPFGDDFAYSGFVHYALEDGTSVADALFYIIKTYYFGWQGTYTAALLMALQPAVWGEQAYVLTTVVMLLSLIVPTALLTDTIMRRCFGLSVWDWAIATAGLLLLTIFYQVSGCEAFYWWNGAVYYTFFYGQMLLLVTCVLRMRLQPAHPKCFMVAALVLAFIIGGGNYVTGLFSCLLLFGYALLCLIWDRKNFRNPAIVGIVVTLCFLVNALAPGNAVRQAASVGMDVPAAIISSVLQVAVDTRDYMNLPILGYLLLMIPLLWKIAGRTEFSFPWPLAVSVILVLALASQNTPHFYALSTAGPGRLRNIIFDSWLWMLLLLEGYWVGWLRSRLSCGKLFSDGVGKVIVLPVLVISLMALVFGFSETSTGRCVQALADGSARAYDRCATAWEERLKGEEADVVVEALENPTDLLYYFNICGDENAFANKAAATYYRKNSVVALPAEEIQNIG